MRIATIDVGTNTALLLVSEIDVAAMRAGNTADALTPLYEARRFVRLGEGVDASRRIGPNALTRLRRALRDHASTARAWGAERIVVGGTSASRDAENQAELVAFVREETGLDYEILSGEDEAQWTFAGAVSAIPDLGERCTVIDIGGGSTEIIVGDAAGAELDYRRSLDVGSVRMTERFFEGSLPPSGEAVDRAASWTAELVEAAEVPAGAKPLVGAAGTAVVLAQLHHGVSSWDELGDGQAVVPRAAVRSWRDRLLGCTAQEVLRLNPSILRGREDVFPAGVLILDVLMHHLDAPALHVSSRGVRHGLALREVHRLAAA